MGEKISSNCRAVPHRRLDQVLRCEADSCKEKDLQQEKRGDTGQSRLVIKAVLFFSAQLLPVLWLIPTEHWLPMVCLISRLVN